MEEDVGSLFKIQTAPQTQGPAYYNGGSRCFLPMKKNVFTWNMVLWAGQHSLATMARSGNTIPSSYMPSMLVGDQCRNSLHPLQGSITHSKALCFLLHWEMPPVPSTASPMACKNKACLAVGDGNGAAAAAGGSSSPLPSSVPCPPPPPPSTWPSVSLCSGKNF